jgi:FtsP/CotA-like multicopper oxidase with cupredoxin domain
MLTRRALLGGGLAALLIPIARAATPLRLEAAALPGGGFGYDGASPGPTLRVAAGSKLALSLANRLDAPTSLAFFGGRLANGVSGFPGLSGPPLAAGAEAAIELAPAAPGFALYGAYDSPFAAGLFGALVIDESAPPSVDLDAIVIISDGVRLNGAPAPLKLAAPAGGRVRIRLANAAPALTLILKVDGAIPHIVAIDGAPSEAFEPFGNAFPIAPSARFELLLDMPEAPGATVAFVLNGDGERPLLQIGTTAERPPARPAIAALPASPRLPREIALERALPVTVTLTGGAGKGYAVNGAASKDFAVKPLFKAARGAPVSLTLVNKTDTAQTLRLEGHVARQLHALDDGWDPYWRDALSIGPGKTLHAAFVADNPGRWPLASASPEARGQGLRAWFQVG